MGIDQPKKEKKQKKEKKSKKNNIIIEAEEQEYVAENYDNAQPIMSFNDLLGDDASAGHVSEPREEPS